MFELEGIFYWDNLIFYYWKKKRNLWLWWDCDLFHFISFFFSGFSLYLWSQNNLLHPKYKIYEMLEGTILIIDKPRYIVIIRRNKGIRWRWDDSFYFLHIIIIIFLNISLTSLSNRSIVWQVLYCVLSHMCVLAVVRFIFATSH